MSEREEHTITINLPKIIYNFYQKIAKQGKFGGTVEDVIHYLVYQRGFFINDLAMEAIKQLVREGYPDELIIEEILGKPQNVRKLLTRAKEIVRKEQEQREQARSE